jgi:hypothetical protein
VSQAGELLALFGCSVLQNKTSLDQLFQDVILNPSIDQLKEVRDEISADMAESDRKFAALNRDSETGEYKVDLDKMQDFNIDCHRIRRKILSYMASVTAVLAASINK